MKSVPLLSAAIIAAMSAACGSIRTKDLAGGAEKTGIVEFVVDADVSAQAHEFSVMACLDRDGEIEELDFVYNQGDFWHSDGLQVKLAPGTYNFLLHWWPSVMRTTDNAYRTGMIPVTVTANSTKRLLAGAYARAITSGVGTLAVPAPGGPFVTGVTSGNINYRVTLQVAR